MATHSSVLAWRIPGTGEPGGLPSVGLHRVGHDRSDLVAAAAKSQKQEKISKEDGIQLWNNTIVSSGFQSGECVLEKVWKGRTGDVI